MYQVVELDGLAKLTLWIMSRTSINATGMHPLTTQGDTSALCSGCSLALCRCTQRQLLDEGMSHFVELSMRGKSSARHTRKKGPWSWLSLHEPRRARCVRFCCPHPQRGNLTLAGYSRAVMRASRRCHRTA